MSPSEPQPIPGERKDAARDLSAEVEALVTQWAGAIHRAARRYGLDSAEQDEVTQDVRLRFWNLLQRGGGGVGAINASYAMRAAMSAAVDLVRRDRQRRGSMSEPLEELPGAATSEHVLQARLAEALEALIPSRRLPVRLHLDGCSLEEIARILRWSEAQVRNQVYRGLADLKAHLRGGIT